MTEAEKAQIGERVLTIISSDFHNDLTEIWAEAVSLAEKIPDQANNEIRNALTHLARALAAENIADAEKNISQARGHFERAKRDLLKISIIWMSKHLTSMVSLIEHKHGILPVAARKRFLNIRTFRRAISKSESRGETIYEDLEKLLTDCYDFEIFLLETYTVPNRYISGFLSFCRNLWSKLFSFMGGVIAAIVGGIVVLAISPNTIASISDFIGRIFH